MPSPGPDAARLAEVYRLALGERRNRGPAGERLGKGTGASLEFQDRRVYAAGDDVRHLDWAAYARTDQMMVRLYREEVLPTVELLVDGESHRATALGIGPVDAVFKAIAELTETESHLLRYQVNAITGGMEQLIQNPDQRQRLIDDPSLIPVAVEEMLRHVTPVRSFVRTATRDTELQGQRIKKGQKVFMIYTAANRDPEQFEDPHRFDVARNPTHLGFGIGNHFCLGSHLARMEFCVALEELLRRLPDMEFSRGGPEFGTSALVRTCTHMWVKYTPEA